VLLAAVTGVSITSRSNLNPAHGVDYVFYGGLSDFLAQEVTTGDFNHDGLGDVVATGLWDDPTQDPHIYENVNGCAYSPQWGRWVFQKGTETKTICAFPDTYYGPKQWNYWHDRGWTAVDTLQGCGTCDYSFWQSVDNGAAYVFMGGSWIGKSRDNNGRDVASS
jgi:hypothetical protein